MPRTTASDVAELFDTDLSTASGDALDEWLAIANTLVDDIANRDSSISSTRLTQIEKLVTAHFAAAQDPRLSGYSVGGASGEYQVDVGEGFNATSYGSRAIALDPTNVLASSTKPTAELSVPEVKTT